MQDAYEKYRAEKEKRHHQHQPDEHEIQSAPWRIFGARIHQTRRAPYRLWRRFYLDFGNKMI